MVKGRLDDPSLDWELSGSREVLLSGREGNYQIMAGALIAIILSPLAGLDVAALRVAFGAKEPQFHLEIPSCLHGEGLPDAVRG